MIDFDRTVLAACMGAFATPLQYVPAGGAPVTVRGIFEESLHELRMSADGAMVDTAHPVLGLRVSELLAASPTARLPQQNDIIVLLPDPALRPALWNTTWTIKEAPGPDGAGHFRLGLLGPR